VVHSDISAEGQQSNCRYGWNSSCHLQVSFVIAYWHRGLLQLVVLFEATAYLSRFRTMASILRL